MTVVSGTVSGSYPAGAVVTITANAAATGKVFEKWTATAGTIASATSASTTFTMPASVATVTANYKDAPPSTYILTVVDGYGSGEYLAGETIHVSAAIPVGLQIFSCWEGDTNGISDVGSMETTLTMPASNVTITAAFTLLAWNATVSFSSTHSETARGSKDAYSITATITVAQNAPVAPTAILTADSMVSISIGTFNFSDKISNATTKRITAKLGYATFKTDAGEMITFRWDTRRITVSVSGKPAVNADSNLIDLSVYEPGKAADTLEECSIAFGDAVWSGSMSWTGTVRLSKNYLFWTAKGKANQ